MKRGTVLLDCRWLGKGGAGRVTELALRGLAARPPNDRWVLWGPPAVEGYAWPGAEVVGSTVDPRALFGQRQWLQVPHCDLAVFFHQQRPLRPASSIAVIHDTIPLRFATSRLQREAKRQFLRRVASLSSKIVTFSEYASSCIQRDLGVADSHIVVLGLPFDSERADRIVALRAELPPEPVALYVGNFMAHKNVPRLIDAFRRTEFRKRAGGRLLLVGGTEPELSKLGVSLGLDDHEWLAVRPGCSEDELLRLMATARLLVQPSLDEGFGLPAFEALCSALPLCVSDGGSLPETTRGLVPTFPARSVEAMAEAIDRSAAAFDSQSAAGDVAQELRRTSPTVPEFGDAFQDMIASCRP